jgi:hypothetical protein
MARLDRVGERGDRASVAHVQNLTPDIRPPAGDPGSGSPDAIEAATS